MERALAQRRLVGSIVPMVTPFTPDDEIDEAAFRRLVDWQIAEGSHGISVTGTTGEPSALSLEERKRMIDLCVDAVRGRVPTVVGTGTNNFRETLELTRHAERAGADAALVIVPYYNRPTQEGLYRHFRAIAESTSLPVIIYNIPGRTAVNLEVETLARLYSDCPNIVGVKEANTNLQQVSDEIAACPGINVYSGIEALCFPMLALGGAGHVSATANVAPREVARLYDLVVAGRWEEARALHYRLLPLNEALFLETNPGPVKTALGWLGRIHPALRLPLAPPGPATQARLRRAMEGLGLLSPEAAEAHLGGAETARP
ncbi:MAG: 4-hydroxy-tetrahydrodipicolinate synthase [Clostridia bacterium]|nr:4-hydroxy-tetrahydrodipicolinate synthase [Clostridia bacterium]